MQCKLPALPTHPSGLYTGMSRPGPGRLRSMLPSREALDWQIKGWKVPSRCPSLAQYRPENLWPGGGHASSQEVGGGMFESGGNKKRGEHKETAQDVFCQPINRLAPLTAERTLCSLGLRQFGWKTSGGWLYNKCREPLVINRRREELWCEHILLPLSARWNVLRSIRFYF